MSKVLKPFSQNTTKIIEDDIKINYTVELECPCAEKKRVENVVDLRAVFVELNVMQKECQCADDQRLGDVVIEATNLTSSSELTPSVSTSNSTVFVFDETSDLENSDVRLKVMLKCPCGDIQTVAGAVDLRDLILSVDGMSRNCKKCGEALENAVDGDEALEKAVDGDEALENAVDGDEPLDNAVDGDPRDDGFQFDLRSVGEDL